MKSKIVLTVASLLLLVNVQAIAGSLQGDNNSTKLITPTLWARHIPGATADTLNDAGFACNLTNVGNKMHTVQVRIISNGVVLLDSGEVDLASQHTANYAVDGFPNGAPIYCEFTVEGSKNDYRGDAKLFHFSTQSSDFAAIGAY